MSDVTIIGLDLAKRVFQLHGARADGAVAFRKKLTRAQLLPFLGDQPRCVVAMEACATAHGWGREIAKLGHTVRLIPPIYVKHPRCIKPTGVRGSSPSGRIAQQSRATG